MVTDQSDSERGNDMGYSFWLAAKGLIYAPSNRQDSTYHGICYTSRGAPAVITNSSMGLSWRIDPMTHHIMSECSYHRATSHSYSYMVKDHSDRALAGTRDSSMGPSWGIDPTTHRTMSKCSYHLVPRSIGGPLLVEQIEAFWWRIEALWWHDPLMVINDDIFVWNCKLMPSLSRGWEGN